MTMKLYEVHVDAHAVIEVSARNEDEARERASKAIDKDFQDIHWDFDIQEAEDITPKSEEE